MTKIPALAASLLLAACAPQPPPIPEVATPPAAAETTARPASAPPDPSPERLVGGAEIDVLERLYAATAKTSPDRPKLLRRLAEDYVWLEVAAQRDGRQAVAEQARRKAIERYTILATEHPSFCSGGGKGCIDEVLFHLAYEHEQAREMDEARRWYREIITAWPQSRYVPNAYLAFAEMFFDQAANDPSKLAEAEKAYQEVLRYPPPDNKVAGYAHYKLGFVCWNKGDMARALDQMAKAIEVSTAHPELPMSPKLAKEARRDLVPIYVAAGDPAKAYDFLAAKSGDKPGEREHLYAMLEALAQAYLDAGKPEGAVAVSLAWLGRGAGPKTCAVVKSIDAAIAAPSGNPGQRAKAQLAASASTPLMKARVECATAP
jgi:tetratricopeptide (TPR) repeat protein